MLLREFKIGFATYITQLAESITFMPGIEEMESSAEARLCLHTIMCFSIDQIEVLQNELFNLSDK